jgi:hypothetical protein
MIIFLQKERGALLVTAFNWQHLYYFDFVLIMASVTFFGASE